MKRAKQDATMQLDLGLPTIDEAAVEHLAHPPRSRRKSPPVAACLFETLEAAASLLSSSPDYQVLRRLQDHVVYQSKVSEREFIGVYVDCETEGLSLEDKIIEVGLVRFAYDANTGEVLRLLEPTDGYSAFEDPGRPLSEEIKKLTGIEDSDVKDQHFDDAAIDALVSDAQLIIAHNAGFDRPRFEKRFPFFAKRRWACSFKDIDWSNRGVPSAKLDYLAYVFGFFFDGHRAVNDCFAALEILGKTFPESGEPVMQALLDRARNDTWRHFANPSRYQNDRFRALGYRWCGKDRAASWYKDYSDQSSAELAKQAIQSEGIAAAQDIRRITARERYSIREMGNE
jgi:DNA polymerase-3 subunit epsilon